MFQSLSQMTVFADDLTGAMEVGLQSYPALVLNHLKGPAICPNYATTNTTIVINTQTRELSAEDVYQATKEKSQAISVPKDATKYYKIDSTLRANIGAGIKALRETLQTDLVIIAPALPQNGRITQNGVHYVLENGCAVQVHETQYAKDIIVPAPTSYVPNIIGYQLGEPVDLILLSVVQQGWLNIKTALEGQTRGAVIAVDAVTPDDLDNIATAIHQSKLNILSVGSAGLFKALCRVIGHGQKAAPKITDWTRQFPHTCLPRRMRPVCCAYGTGRRRQVSKHSKVIVLAGSLNRRTDLQIETAMATLGDKLKMLQLDVSKIIAKGIYREQEIGRLREDILSSLRANKHPIVKTNRTLFECSQEKRDDIVYALGETINDDSIMERTAVILLTGGQTAYFVTQALGASGIEIRGEIEPFVPIGALMGGKYEGALVITKAGGFGSQRIIVDTIPIHKKHVG